MVDSAPLSGPFAYRGLPGGQFRVEIGLTLKEAKGTFHVPLTSLG